MQEKFKEFYFKVVVPNTPSYNKHFNGSNFDELIDMFKESYGVDPFTINSSIQIKDFIAQKKEPFVSYSQNRGSDVPQSILNKHFSMFLNFNKIFHFKDLQSLINYLHELLGKKFIDIFQKERIKLNGNSKIASSSEIFGKVRNDYWTINKGSELEIQFHILKDDNTIRYGLGFNAQKTQNNLKPLENIAPFINSFFKNKSKVENILSGFSFLNKNANDLKNIKEGEFILLGKLLQIKLDTSGFQIEGLDLLEMYYNIKNRLFNAYKLIFEDSKLSSRFKHHILNIMKFNNILHYKKQIILQGPPGTGKTRLAKEIALEMLGLNDTEGLKNNEQFKLIQFHPSYTYEDFVRGIVAESKGEKIEYKNVNKTLGEFAEKALENYQDARKSPEIISKETWLREKYEGFKDKIEKDLESGELLIKDGTKPKITAIEDDAIRVNRYSDEKDSVLIKDSDIINGYNGLYFSNPIIKIKDNSILSKSARSGMYYLYQNLIEKFKNYLEENNLLFGENLNVQKIKEKPFVLIIDEINRANLSSVLGELIYALEYRGEAVDSMYDVDGKELILPPNLYIIGTMNTADRSVGHIDYAIRRRFAFVDVLPKDLTTELQDDFMIDKFNQVASLFVKDYDPELDYNDDSIIIEKSEHLTADFEPKDVWLGHSYFIQQYQEDENGNMQPINFNLRIKYEIKPILLEYIKDGILKESALKIINDIETHIADA
ncbi:AAA family ATPase [Elizabethkingia miricola]|uniref:AAA family ATPase n=1 Tax=Elizabethkingia miricola TaxID=172045 RepID=UPI0038923BBD